MLPALSLHPTVYVRTENVVMGQYPLVKCRQCAENCQGAVGTVGGSEDPDDDTASCLESGVIYVLRSGRT